MDDLKVQSTGNLKEMGIKDSLRKAMRDDQRRSKQYYIRRVRELAASVLLGPHDVIRNLLVFIHMFLKTISMALNHGVLSMISGTLSDLSSTCFSPDSISKINLQLMSCAMRCKISLRYWRI